MRQGNMRYHTALGKQLDLFSQRQFELSPYVNTRAFVMGND